jgi:FlaA1/EpsC-like NDP-sugar epimerase
MYKYLNIQSFINQHITHRANSLFREDLEINNNALAEAIDGTNVLVIGGAGTIGSSFIKALLNFKVKKLVVVDINENGLTELVRDLRSTNGLVLPDDFKTYPVSFSDTVFSRIFLSNGPFDIVANFAAHKHVRSEKDAYSVQAMIENNVIRAYPLLKLLSSHKPKAFFSVSTDKAANPVNVMGASKKLMEDLLFSFSDRLHITTARFANVAFSNGSLLFGYLERLAKQQPLSCPLGIKRFFVSPQESGQICMLGAALGKGRDIVFPKLSAEKDLISFSDITLDFIKYLGLTPQICKSEEEARLFFQQKDTDGRYPVYLFESDTTGEKPYEEFFTDAETLDMDTFKGLGVIQVNNPPSESSIALLITELQQLFEQEKVQKADIVEVLKSNMSGFSHNELQKNLDQRM